MLLSLKLEFVKWSCKKYHNGAPFPGMLNFAFAIKVGVLADKFASPFSLKGLLHIALKGSFSALWLFSRIAPKHISKAEGEVPKIG